MKEVGKNILETLGGVLIILLYLSPIIVGCLLLYFFSETPEDTIKNCLIYICIVAGVLILIAFLIAYFSESIDRMGNIKTKKIIKRIGEWLDNLAGILWIIFISSLITLLILILEVF